MKPLDFELLFEFSVNVAFEPQRVGDGPAGKRQIFPIADGTFDGPTMRGRILPGGGDWLAIRPDGVGELDVRITLETDDGAVIYMRYPGILHFPEEARAKMRAGEAVSAAEYYMRSTPRFETGDERYGWLNRTVAVGVGERTDTGVAYSVYAIL